MIIEENIPLKRTTLLPYVADRVVRALDSGRKRCGFDSQLGLCL